MSILFQIMRKSHDVTSNWHGKLVILKYIYMTIGSLITYACEQSIGVRIELDLPLTYTLGFC